MQYTHGIPNRNPYVEWGEIFNVQNSVVKIFGLFVNFKTQPQEEQGGNWKLIKPNKTNRTKSILCALCGHKNRIVPCEKCKNPEKFRGNRSVSWKKLGKKWSIFITNFFTILFLYQFFPQFYFLPIFLQFFYPSTPNPFIWNTSTGFTYYHSESVDDWYFLGNPTQIVWTL